MGKLAWKATSPPVMSVRRRGQMEKRRMERGQGLVEMVIVLPVLLILLLGVVEMGYAMRNYLIIVNANREGCRFAARGRFDDDRVGDRVVSAGGFDTRLGTGVPFLRTGMDSPDPNTAIIITHIPMDSSGDVLAYTTWISGVIPSEGGGMQFVVAENSMITTTMAEIVARHRDSTQSINAMREAAMYEPMDNRIVVVETFFAHHPLWNTPIIPLPDPWLMHTRTEMRVTTDRGGGARRFFGAW
jgi:hypothetical protein